MTECAFIRAADIITHEITSHKRKLNRLQSSTNVPRKYNQYTELHIGQSIYDDKNSKLIEKVQQYINS